MNAVLVASRSASIVSATVAVPRNTPTGGDIRSLTVASLACAASEPAFDGGGPKGAALSVGLAWEISSIGPPGQRRFGGRICPRGGTAKRNRPVRPHSGARAPGEI